MKPLFFKLSIFLFLPFIFTACFNNYPVDEDGLLITNRSECYVSSFKLFGIDFVSVVFDDKEATVDTVNCTIKVKVKYGSDLKNVYPIFSLVTDAKLDPKITGITDFSNYKNNPPKYTVISGNRKVKKTYTIYIEEYNFQP
ncbi:MAG: hypothetical protein WBI53_11270 [Paludibacter sp.]